MEYPKGPDLLVSITLLLVVFPTISHCTPRYQLDGPALPNRPWLSVWNGPTDSCSRFGVRFNLSHFDIVQNSDDRFFGEFMTILFQPGAFPSIVQGRKVNGGIPQLGNLTRHLELVKQTILIKIPDSDFKGLAVIDFESYRPLWDEDWDTFVIYKNMSRDLVRQKHPDWTKEQIEKTAKKEFEFAARVFMLQTLKLAEILRPKGHWGYYHYPYCFDSTASLTCRDKFKDLNDREFWLFDNSQALYPSTYLNGYHRADERWKITHAILQEAFRAAYGKQRRLPVYPYTKFQYNERSPFWFYTTNDLTNTIKMAADFGSAGSIIWSSSEDYESREGCLLLQAFMDKRLGPFVRNVTNFTVQCSKEKCSNNGRCVKREYFPDEYVVNTAPTDNDRENLQHLVTNTIFHNAVPTLEQSSFDNYICHCYEGWHGSHCETPDK